MSESSLIMPNGDNNRIYVPLHCHTEHSVLDGLSKPAELAKRAKELGMPACAITDHGAMSGCVEFYQACRKEGIKPILGMEAYTTPYGHSLDERVSYDVKELRDVPGKGHQRNNYHLILLAKNYTGYMNLCALHTASYAQGYYYKPRIDFELLKQHHEGLICSNACFTSGHQVRVKSTKGGIITQNIEDVKAGQYVLTHDNTWQKVIEPTSRDYNGDGYHITISHQLAHEREITCTANHEFLVYDKQTNDVRWVSADLLHKNDVLLEPLTYKRIYRSSRRNDGFVISAAELNSLMKELYTIIPEESLFTEDLYITPAMMMTFGLWLADGSITPQAHRVCFTFNNTEFQFFYDNFLLQGLKDMGMGVLPIPLFRDEHSRADLAIHDKKIFTVFTYLFDNAKGNDKHIPNKLKHITKKYDAALLYGYMLGDGSFHYENESEGGQVICVSISQQLIIDIYELLTWFEFSPSVETALETVDKNGTHHQQSWHLKVNNTLLASLLDKEHIFDESTFERILEAAQLWGNKKKTNIVVVNGVKYRMKTITAIEKIRLNETVYCLNVDHNHDFVCNGVIVHNCVLGEVNHHLLHEDFGMARDHALRLLDLFGDDYYFEIMNHSLDMEIAIMPRIRELAKELGVKVIATNDNHFTYKNDAKLQRTMMLLGMHKSWQDPDVVGSFFDDDIISPNSQKLAEGEDGDSDPIFAMPPSLYVKDYNEMMEVLCLSPEDEEYARQELANTLEVASKCNCELPIIDPNDMSQYHTPLYAIEKDIQYDDYKDSGFELRQATIDKVVAAMNESGKEGTTLEEVLNEHERASIHFLMWMCEKGIEERIRPKIEARGEPLPLEFYIKNPPEGFQVVHKHNSPDESFIKGKLDEGLTPEDIINLYFERLDYEVSVVCRKGFLDYFSIVQQYCNYARFNDSPPGPGRGSGAGALLNYLLGITSVDPLPNKLIFERFLNPDRVGYPDIDVDFDKAFRDGIGEYQETEGDGLGGGLKGYLRREYGADNAAGVATFIYAWGKAALRAAARVLFNPPESVQWADDLCNLIDDHPKLDLNSELQEGVNPNFVAKMNSAKHYKQIVDLALMLQGRITGTSIHASAFILSPFKITDKMPLTVPKAERERVQKTGEKTVDFLISYDGVITQESLGFVKLDLLCIKDLEVLTHTMKTIERVYGCKIDIENIPMDDEAVFQMLYDHNVAGIFQLDGSSGMAKVMDDVKPQSIEEMNAVIALFRPGPMDYIPNYVHGKWHPDQVKYLDPRLEPILKDTYGVCVAEGTPVITRRGQIEIEQISAGDEVLTETGEYRRCDRLVDNGVKDCLKVKSDRGEEIICTPEHRFLTQRGWVAAKSLNTSDIIKWFSPFDKKEIEPFDEKDWLLGLFIADGHSKNSTVKFSCESEEFARGVAEAIHRVFPNMKGITVKKETHECSSGREGTTWYVNVAQKQGQNGSFSKQYEPNDFVAFLKENGLHNKTKENKIWPEHYSFSTLLGFIEGDGCYKNRTIVQKNKAVLYAVYKGLCEYGIQANFSRRNDNLCWIVNFQYKDVLRPHIWLTRYEDLTKVRPSTFDESKCYGGFIPSELLNDTSMLDLMSKSDRRQVREKDKISLSLLQRYNIELAGKHLEWARVKSITPAGQHHVYDLTIDSIHSYVANGYVIHNCAYQEEAMQITQAIAGFTGGQADNYRKQAAKKHMDQLVLIKDDFINGALANDTDPAVADELWEQLVKFGSYAFNRSHSAAYAYIAYRGGFLKAHFPECFLAAMCSIKPMMKKTDKVPSYLEEARQMGVTVKPPHVNYSMNDFDVPEKGVIAFGLGGIKRVGQGAAPIIAEREANGQFKDFTDFCTRVPKQVGKGPLEALIKAGALDGLGWSRMAMEESIDQIVDFRKRWFAEKEKKDLFADDLFGFADDTDDDDPGIELVAPFDTEYSERELMNKEKEQFGMYFEKDPRDFFRVSRYITEKRLSEQATIAFKAGAYDHPRFVNAGEAITLPDKTLVQFVANIGEVKAFRTKKGDMMASIYVWDNGVAESSRFGFAPTKTTIKCTVFPKTWANTTPPLVDDVVVITGRVSVDPNGEWPTAILVDKIEQLRPDTDWIGSAAPMSRAQEYAEAFEEMSARDAELADPSSARYMIPALSFKNETDLDAFLLDPDLEKYRGDGRVLVSVSGDETGRREEVVSLKQTRGMVAFAARYGAIAAKVRLPKAQRALERRAMMSSDSTEPTAASA